MPVVLDDLTYHGRVRVEERVLPIYKVAALLKKGLANITQDTRGNNTLRCEVAVDGVEYRFIVAITKKVGTVLHGYLITGYAITV